MFWKCKCRLILWLIGYLSYVMRDLDPFHFSFLQVELCSRPSFYKSSHLVLSLSHTTLSLIKFFSYLTAKSIPGHSINPSSYQPIRMSQLQFQAPANPAPSAAPLQLAPPQPGFSIPCATAPLPSESASHPLRNSALPSASATPFCNPTGGW